MLLRSRQRISSRCQVDRTANRCRSRRNHSHFVLAPGHASRSRARVAVRTRRRARGGSRVVAILVGGGSITKPRPSAPSAGVGRAPRRADGRFRRPGSRSTTRPALFVAGMGSTAPSGSIAEYKVQDAAGGPRAGRDRPLGCDSASPGGDAADFARELAWGSRTKESSRGRGAPLRATTHSRNAHTTFSRFRAAAPCSVGIGGTFLALLEDSVGFGGWIGDTSSVGWSLRCRSSCPS